MRIGEALKLSPTDIEDRELIPRIPKSGKEEKTVAKQTLQKEYKMKRFLTISMLILFVVATASGVSYAQPKKSKMQTKMALTKSSVELKMAMRKLWEDHITYTRNYIISAVADLEDTSKIAERLLKNQDDIGDAIKPIYGDEAGKKLAVLLRDHILIATEVVKAAKMGNNEELSKASKKWNANADDISVFLSGANPNWPKNVLQDMLYKHLEYTTQEAVSRLKKDWASDIEAYDKGHVHMLMFSDVLTDGIVKQFPSKFKK
jgi:hypothetical protein